MALCWFVVWIPTGMTCMMEETAFLREPIVIIHYTLCTDHDIDSTRCGYPAHGYLVQTYSRSARVECVDIWTFGLSENSVSFAVPWKPTLEELRHFHQIGDKNGKICDSEKGMKGTARPLPIMSRVQATQHLCLSRRNARSDKFTANNSGVSTPDQVTTSRGHAIHSCSRNI